MSTIQSPTLAIQPDLPTCALRYEFNSTAGLYFCGHPKVIAANDLVSAAICRVCSRCREPLPDVTRPFPTKILLGRSGPCAFLGPLKDLRDCPTCTGNVQIKVFICEHPHHEETTYNECATCYDYERSLSVGSVTNWAVGILEPTDNPLPLSEILKRLRPSGFSDRNVCVFNAERQNQNASSGSTQGSSLRLTPWSRFYLGLAELYQRFPLANAFLFLRENVELSSGLRLYLEKTLWPAKSLGFVVIDGSLNSDPVGSGFHPLDGETSPNEFRAIVFPNASLRMFLGSIQVVDYPLSPQSTSVGQIETVLARWSRECDMTIFGHSPNLAK